MASSLMVVQPHSVCDSCIEMPTWRLDLAWDGTAYIGWQRQPNGTSIQQVIEEVLHRIFAGEEITVTAAGRTDSGVHALHQVASFSSQIERSPQALIRGLNGLLPDDIVCKNAAIVDDRFHARYQTKWKMYRYRILSSPTRDPHRRKKCWHWRASLQLSAMIEAAGFFVGDHDFKSFQSVGCGALHSTRTITSATVRGVDDEIHFEVVGKGFLRHQVRIMAGTLLEVGRGNISPRVIPQIIAARDRSLAGPTAPPYGLWLVHTEMNMEPRKKR